MMKTCLMSHPTNTDLHLSFVVPHAAAWCRQCLGAGLDRGAAFDGPHPKGREGEVSVCEGAGM